MHYLYLDESGCLGLENGSGYFLIACIVTTADTLELTKLLDAVRKKKRFKKELKRARLNEIKGNKCSRDLNSFVLSQLNKLGDVKCYCAVLEKEKLYSSYLKGKPHKRYNYVAGLLASIIHLDSNSVEVRIDRSKGKKLLRDDFDQHFKRLLEVGSDIHTVTVEHSYSHGWAGLQFADMLSWACFQKFEHGDSSYIDILDEDRITIHKIWS